MRIQTFSILAGSEACNARCPFCVSKMTLSHGVSLREPEVNWRNFRKACRLAQLSGVTTAMFTGKGEPTLFPAQLTRFLEALAPFEFPLIELQTNGILPASRRERYAGHLKDWHRLGMTTLAVSIVHYDPEKNRSVYVPHLPRYPDLPALIRLLHDHGFSVRLTCILARGFIDSVEGVKALAGFARDNRVEQLTVTPVNKPDSARQPEYWEWTREHHLPRSTVSSLMRFLEAHGTRLMHLAHGACVYDLEGQNICLNNCLTLKPKSEELRNLIFFPDGHLRYYWQYGGAILL